MNFIHGDVELSFFLPFAIVAFLLIVSWLRSQIAQRKKCHKALKRSAKKPPENSNGRIRLNTYAELDKPAQKTLWEKLFCA